MHIPDLRSRADRIEYYARLTEALEKEAVNMVSNDPLKFLEQICKLKPYWYVLDIVQAYQQNQFLAVRWPRQTGKSTTIGALHLESELGF